MKAAETKPSNVANQHHAGQPFFGKEGSAFFDGNEAESSAGFFSMTGNSPRLSGFAPVQTKLTVGEPNDKYEKEADEAADQVVRRKVDHTKVLADSFENSTINNATDFNNSSLSSLKQPLQAKCAECEKEEKKQELEEKEEDGKNEKRLQKKPAFESSVEPPDDDEEKVQRKCEHCEEEEEHKVQKKSEPKASDSSTSIESSLNASKGSGNPLPEPIQKNMGGFFKADFSGVRVHYDSRAVQMSKNLNAQAFTQGNDIYFNSGKYDTNSDSGKHLLAHELTHTIQQGSSIRRQTPELQKEQEITNFDFSFQFKEEYLVLSIKLSDAALSTVNSNPDSKTLINQGLDQVLYINKMPVAETPTFLATNRVLVLIKADIESWSGVGIPQMKRLNELISKRNQSLLNTLYLQKVNEYLRLNKGIDPAFIDWKVLLPQLKTEIMMKTPESAFEASDYDRYEWVLDLLANEVSTFEPVVGAKVFVPAEFHNLLYPFIVNSEELFSEEVIQAHSEKFLVPWIEKIQVIKFVPEGFSLKDFAPGDDLKKAEANRERLLKDFIEKEVPDLMFQFILDQWTGSGVNPDIWLKNLNIDSYKDTLLDQLTELFIEKADQDPEYLASLRLQSVEKVKFDLIGMFYLKANGMQSDNEQLLDKFSLGYKDKLDKELIPIIENPAEYYDLSVQVASATTTFLSNISPDRSIGEETFKLITSLSSALNIPEQYGLLMASFLLLGDYIKRFKDTISEEKTKVKEAISKRIIVDYDRIARVVKNWQHVADEFMDRKFKPMLKTVALEWLADNKKEIENILTNYDSSNSKYVAMMNDGAAELQLIVDGLMFDEYEEVEYQGQVVTKRDVTELNKAIQFMHDEANARSSTKNSEEEKGKLRDALGEYEKVKKDVINDEFDWLDYTKEIFVEARKRLGISEFPENTTFKDVFTGKVVAEKSPFLAMVIQNWYWKEDVDRKMFEAFKILGLGILTVGAMFVPGIGGVILGFIDVAIGIGMGVKGVIDAKEVLRMAKLDVHGTIRGVSVEEAEKALKHAWIGLVVTLILTAGPSVVKRVLKVRGLGGVELSEGTLAWERTLTKETRDALKVSPNLRKIYAEMDESVRALLTLCESPCIPLGSGPSAAEVGRIKAFMKKVKVPDNHAGLREYLHHPSRRGDLTAAMDGLDGVNNISQLDARLERAIIANVKQAGASAAKVGGVWKFTRPDGTVVTEFEVGIHGGFKTDNGTAGFFQSHHGIQDSWAMNKGVPGYARDDCPAILLRDSKMGTPHQVVSARQSARFKEIGSRTYAQERNLLLGDMKAAGVPTVKANQLLSQSDVYFAQLFRKMKAQGKNAEILEIFGTWKP